MPEELRLLPNKREPRFPWNPSKEPTVPCDPPFFMLYFAEQTKEPTVENEFREKEGPREPRFPSMGSVWFAKDNIVKGGLQGTVGSLSMKVGCSAKDNPSKGGSQGTVGSLCFCLCFCFCFCLYA